MALSPQENIQLQSLLAKASEPPAAPPAAPAMDAAMIRSIVAESMSQFVPGLTAVQNQQRPEPPSPPKEPVKPAAPAFNALEFFNHHIRPALTSEQVGKLSTIGVSTLVQNGMDIGKTKEQVMAAGLEFIHTNEGKTWLQMGVDSFFGVIAAAEEAAKATKQA